MQHLKNLKKYTPDDDHSLYLIDVHGAEFFISDDGRDWYRSQADFSPDTLKIAYDADGIIRSISKDVSSIYPRDFSVTEVAITEKNQTVDIFGGWVFSEGEIKPRQYSPVELCLQAEVKKAELLSVAATKIAPLQDAVDLGDASEEETALLIAWKKYRVQINRIKLEDASSITWPEQPA